MSPSRAPHMMTRLRLPLVALATAGLLLPGLSVITAAPASAEQTTVTLAGDFQDDLGCPGDWQPECPSTIMSDDDSDGVYTFSATIPEGTWNFKAALNKTWDESYGVDGNNAVITLAAPTPLTFTFDSSTTRLGVTTSALKGAYDEDDAALVAQPVHAGTDETFYFILTDRFANGDASNDEGGLVGDRLTTGFDPTDKGFYHGGDIQGIIDRLDYIQGLGASTIWLTPSFTNRPVQGEGANASAGYHGYWVTDFTQIDPHLGGNEALARLRDAAHARGMKLYLDIITNHTADLIDYEEKTYTYVDTATVPYRDTNGDIVDVSALANQTGFPTIASSAYTPVRAEGNEVVPSVLNDVMLYHNRGNSTWEGESTTFGDFDGLDDLMTENPLVEKTFEEVYTAWMDFGVDGFRIDTVKHVNREFWELWTSAIDDHAKRTNPAFFTFGEVYSADTSILSPYVRDTKMGATLDFAFQSAALNYAKGYTAKGLSALFAADDMYTTERSSASALPTFLGNHDMGRIGYLLAEGTGSAETLARDELAHSLMFLSRGQPIVYYGDEQGFAGNAPGNDKDARQDMFPTRVADVPGQQLVDGTFFGDGEHFSTDAPLYERIRELSQLRDAHPALDRGAQIELHADDGTGVYAFARVEQSEKIEYLVALNNATEDKTLTLTTLTPNAAYAPLYGAGESVGSDAKGSVTITVPALSALVYRADQRVGVADGGPAVSITLPDGAGRSGRFAEITATTAPGMWAQTSFAYRRVGTDEWTMLGTAEDSTPRVFADLSGLADGTALEVRAVSEDANGSRSADSALVIVGNDLSGAAPDAPPSDGDLVTVPGSHNPAMGCSGEWQPECADAALVKDPESGIYTATFTLPQGQWQYKVAIGGTWDENYGANGVPGGENITYTLDEAGPVTFFYDPATHRVWNTADGPVITLPGTLQAPLGCTRGDNGGNWAPDCLVPLMAPNGDGTWTYSTDKLPTGNYLVKVAHNRSWAENYGVDGAKDGPNYSFSVTSDKTVTFTYTMSTHILDIDVADAPLMGTGQQAAYWVDATTLAWPTAMLPKGVTADQVVSGEAGIGFTLVTADNGGAQIVDGAVAGGESTPLTIIADLPKEATDLRPNLRGYIGLRVPDGFGADAVRRALTGQVDVLATANATPFAFTGAQIAPVLDTLYADDARTAELGVTWTGAKPSFALWAPTAKSVTLLSWNSGDDTGSVPQIDEDARRTPATLGPDGRWVVDNADGTITAGAQYLWEVEVYVPATGKVETNTVTDPYSIALTADSTRSVAIDLMNPAIMPDQWAFTPAPRVTNNASRAIYELHVRDFSAKDESVPAEARGTYKAFTVSDSMGMQALAELAQAGIDTIHLLPTFDIATIPEKRADQVTPTIPDAGPAAEDQQAAITAVADQDAFNWGYDPFHWMTPEGSYATEGHQDGGARIVEYRDMVGALHATGLQVVLDEVYNHTAAGGQDSKAVLDRIVPGYYHRLDAVGAITTSTCCSNIATENIMSEDLMIDSLVLWARAYRVDGFRFDLMGHHSRDTMIRAKQALSALTLEKDGVDGSSLYLYGEGWNFGEVANNALFTQATQGQLDGTGIGAFNDRLRDAVHGGGPFDSDHRVFQGFGSGAVTDPNGLDTRSAEEQLADLMHRTDLVKLGVAGNLKDYRLTTHDGSIKLGSEVDYNSQPAGYASDPAESVNYVDAHDNETLFDLLTYKLPVSTPMEDRVRMNTVSLATVALGQSPSFWAAGTERLRSKSLDRDSYNSGDHFNAIDWTGSDNGFGHGLPVASKNQEQWPIMKPLLEDPSLKPGAEDIAAAKGQALDLLRLRKSTPLFSLGSAQLIEEKVSFPNSGPDQVPGTFFMLIDDTAPIGASAGARSRAAASIDPDLNGVLVVFNASNETLTQAVDGQAGRHFVLSPIQASGSDPVVKATTWDDTTGTVSVPARTVAVLVDEASTPGPSAPLAVSYEPVAVAAGDEASATPIVRDESGEAIDVPEGALFTLGESAPRDAVIDATTGVIRWTVPADHATTAVRIPVTVAFADGQVVTSELVVSVTGRASAADEPSSPVAAIVGALPITGAGGFLLILAIAAAGAVAGGMFASRGRA